MEAAAGIYTSIILPEALSETEPHLSDLQVAMLNATPDCIKVLSVDGTLLTMNKAGCLALGVPEDSKFGMPWLPLLPESVHQLGREALRKAAGGSNARFPGQSQSLLGTKYWDNLLTPVIGAAGEVLSILCVSRDVTAKTLLERELEDAIGRERLLSREMQHRIKNLFAVVAGLIHLSEKEATEENAPESAIGILREKVRALSRAADVAFSSPEVQDSGASQVDLGSLLKSVLQPYGDRCRTIGSPVSVSSRNVTTLALFLHELATNSMKYGALGANGGGVTVRWTADDRGLNLTWIESGGPPVSTTPRKRGFGSEMVDRIVHSSGGEVGRSWQQEGLIAELRLPDAFLRQAG